MKLKKLFLTLGLCLSFGTVALSQRIALIDMDYVRSKIPAYESASKKLEALSTKYQEEISKEEKKAEALYKKFQSEAPKLSATQRKEQEEAIVAQEKVSYDLRRKYFAPDGELSKMRQNLTKPLDDALWEHLKTLANKGGYQIIMERNSGKIVYADPSLDLSGTLLSTLGLSN